MHLAHPNHKPRQKDLHRRGQPPTEVSFLASISLAGVYQLTVHGDSCDGGTSPVSVTIGGSTTVSTTNTIDANAGIDIEGIKIGGGVSNTKTLTTTMSNSTTFSVPPGRQVVQVVGVNHQSQTGQVQVNFGDRVDGHFIVRICLPYERLCS